MAYSKKYFLPYMETHGKEVTHCMGLLACGPETSLRGYQVRKAFHSVAQHAAAY